jgi:hypothetical protein
VALKLRTDLIGLIEYGSLRSLLGCQFYCPERVLILSCVGRFLFFDLQFEGGDALLQVASRLGVLVFQFLQLLL